ncbi:ACT domain-containing protein [Candidatus Villigracilis proximus]|uniref:ACT domain-containing protein n=1 Tax=Candidatus Villigracilis proximus TaxID=3140683 RepID=UPI0031E913E7
MPKNIVLTLTGRDKIGIVDSVTSVIVKRNGNVNASRMTRLGGEFAMLMLIALPDQEFGGLDQDFQSMRSDGYQITLCKPKMIRKNMPAGCLMKLK